MKTFVKKNTWLPMLSIGWGNGYVVIPKGHKLYGKDYDEIHQIFPELSVHGGLTFSESANDLDWPELSSINKENAWVVGFDTAHLGDDKENCNMQYVYDETENLKNQLLSFS